MYGHVSDGAMKHYVRLNMYKASNVTFDPSKIAATSYGWWEFVKVIRGKVVFNNYPYSRSTQGHQMKVRALMRKLRIKVDVVVSFPESLKNFKTIAEAKKYHAEHIVNVAEEKERKRLERNEAARKKRKEFKDKLNEIKAFLEKKRSAVSTSSKKLVDMFDIKKTVNSKDAICLVKEGKLEDNVLINGDLYLKWSGAHMLPDNMEVKGDLNISESKIMVLPLGLKVSGNLYMRRTSIREKDYPKDMQIGGELIR
jgi:hypothetical protein